VKNVVLIAKELTFKTTAEMGYELADVEYVKEDGQMCLNLYIYKDDGISIEDCEAVSKAVDPLLEQEDITNGAPYCLGVSSLGDRPLNSERDFERNLQKIVEVKPKMPLKGKNKSHIGVLLAFDNAQITIGQKGEQLSIKRDEILLVRPYIGF